MWHFHTIFPRRGRTVRPRALSLFRWRLIRWFFADQKALGNSASDDKGQTRRVVSWYNVAKPHFAGSVAGKVRCGPGQRRKPDNKYKKPGREALTGGWELAGGPVYERARRGDQRAAGRETSTKKRQTTAKPALPRRTTHVPLGARQAVRTTEEVAAEDDYLVCFPLKRPAEPEERQAQPNTPARTTDGAEGPGLARGRGPGTIGGRI